MSAYELGAASAGGMACVSPTNRLNLPVDDAKGLFSFIVGDRPALGVDSMPGAQKSRNQAEFRLLCLPVSQHRLRMSDMNRHV